MNDHFSKKGSEVTRLHHRLLRRCCGAVVCFLSLFMAADLHAVGYVQITEVLDSAGQRTTSAAYTQETGDLNMLGSGPMTSAAYTLDTGFIPTLSATVPSADLAITKTDGVPTVPPGGSVTYTIVVSNAGPDLANGATVTDILPAAITSATWSTAVTGGATATASGSGNISDTVKLPAGATVTYTVIAQVSGAAVGTVINTATVSPPAGVYDPMPGNNGATDTDTIDRPPNPGPVFAVRSLAGSVKIPVAQIIAAAPDPDAGDVVTLFSVGNPTAPLHGTATYTGNGSTGFVLYTPNSGDTNGDTFSYMVTDNHGAQASSTVTITVTASGTSSTQITKMTRNPDGSVALNFAGVPGYKYGLQWTDDLLNHPFVDIGPVTMSGVGQAQYLDTAHNASPNVFYRFIYPAP